MGEHKTFGWCAVIEFAGGFEDDEALVNARREAGPPQVAAAAPVVRTQWQLGQVRSLRFETTCPRSSDVTAPFGHGRGSAPPA